MKARERSIKMWGRYIGCLSHAPTWRPSPQPRPVSWPGLEPATCWLAGWHSIHWVTLARAHYLTVYLCQKSGCGLAESSGSGSLTRSPSFSPSSCKVRWLFWDLAYFSMFVPISFPISTAFAESIGVGRLCFHFHSSLSISFQFPLW